MTPRSKAYTTIASIPLGVRNGMLTAFVEQWGTSSVLLVDDKTIIRYVSTRVMQLLDLSAAQLLGKSLYSALVLKDVENNDIPNHRRPLHLAIEQPGFAVYTPYICFIELPSSTRMQVAINVYPFSSGNSKDGLWFILGVREVKKQLDVNEMKSLFTSFAAHQLKTPSGIVKGFLELLLRQGKKAYKNTQWANILSAYESNERLIRRARALLNLTKLEGGMLHVTVRPFNPAESIEQVTESYRKALSYRSITLKVNAPKRKTVSSDASLFLEVFDILFNNAVKHSPDGGALEVTCKFTPHGCELRVQDSGTGLSPDVAEHIFQHSANTDILQNNHGLGLYMARKYMSLLKGSLTVDPHAKRGTIFVATFPTLSAI
jgi:signal transduction histidine kinase